MEKVILTAMQKQPDKRFPSALSFYDAYEKARSTLPKGTISGGSDYKSLLSRLSSSATTIANVALDKLSESVQQATVRRETQGNAQKQSTPPTQRKEKQCLTTSN